MLASGRILHQVIGCVGWHIRFFGLICEKKQKKFFPLAMFGVFCSYI